MIDLVVIMYWLIARENNIEFILGLRSIISLITYSGAAMFGGFCPIAAFIVVAVVSCWWIFPERKRS